MLKFNGLRFYRIKVDSPIIHSFTFLKNVLSLSSRAKPTSFPTDPNCSSARFLIREFEYLCDVKSVFTHSLAHSFIQNTGAVPSGVRHG